MATGRYKAGTIFLDVAPSFDNLQKSIKRHIENGDLEKAAEQQGQRQGEALARGEAEAYRKAAEKNLASRRRGVKAVNSAIVADTEKAAEQMARAVEKASQGETAAVAAGAKERGKIRRDEATEAKNLLKQIDYAHGEAIKENAAREKAAAKAQQDSVKLFGQFYRKELKDRGSLLDQLRAEEAAAAKAVADEERRLADDRTRAIQEFGEQYRAEATKRLDEEKARLAERSRLIREFGEQYQAEAKKKADADKAAAKEKEAADKAEQSRAKVTMALVGRMYRKELKERGDLLSQMHAEELAETERQRERMNQAYQDRTEDFERACDVLTEHAEETAAERERIERESQGRIGRLIRRTVGRVRTVVVRGDTKHAERSLGNLIRKFRELGNADRTLGQDGANAFRIFNIITLAVVASLTLLGPALAVVAAGLATVSGAALAGAGALGVLILGFQGVFQAIGDQIKAEDDLADRAGTAARQRAASARQVRNAKESLADAEVSAARATVDAAERVSDAEQDLADARLDAAYQIERALETQQDAERRLRDAQEDSARAQRDLNEARKEARRDIEDLAMAYRVAKLDEKEAAIAIVQAQQRLAEVRRRARSGDASQADVQSATLDVERARLRQEQAQTRRQRAGQETREANRKGVSGSDVVRDAQEQVADAAQAEDDAQRNLQRATEDVGRTRVAAARQVADAEQRVTDALEEQTRTAVDNARAIRDAQQAVADAQSAAADQAASMSAAAIDARQSMADLTPEGRRFAKFILGLRGQYTKLRNIAQAGMLPGLMQGMKELAIYEQGFERFVGNMSRMWGESFASMGEQLTNSTWRSFFATMGRDGPKQAGLLGQALFNVLETIAALTDAFSPLTTEMLTWFESATGGWAEWAAGLKDSEGFQRFLDYIRRTAPIVKDFLLALGSALIAVGVAMAPFSEGIMKALTRFFEFVADMDPKVLGLIAAGLISVFIALQLGAGAAQLITTLLTPFHRRLTLIVTLVTIAAFALIYFYQTNETARKYIDKFIGKLKQLGKWMLEHISIVSKVAGAILTLMVLSKFIRLTAVARVALMALGKTMRLTFLLNPYVLAIAALVGVIVYLWRTNETFREVVKAAWAAVKTAIGAVVTWLVETAFPAMVGAFKWVWERVKTIMAWLWLKVLRPIFQEMVKWWREIIAPALSYLWQKVWKPIFKAIGNLIRIWWTQFVKPVFKMFVYVLKTLVAPALKWIWNKIIKPIFGLIGAYIAGKVNKVIIPVFKAIRWFLKNILGPALKWFWEKVVSPVFRWIAKRAAWLWDKVRPNFDKFKKGVDAIKDAFKRTKDGIKKIWDGLVDIVKNPIVAAMKFIQNHFIDNINKLLKKAGLKMRLPDILVKVKSRGYGARTGSFKAAGLAKGGILPGYTPMHQGDDRLTPMRSGEGVLVSEGLRDNRSRSMFLAANEAAKRGTSFADFLGRDGYARGGIVDLGKRLQKMGYHVSEHPAFGGVAPGAHSASGYHYRAGALDINADSWNSKFRSEMPALDKLNAMLRSEGWNTIWRSANHWDHLHVDIAKGQRGGLLGNIAEKALDFLADKAKGVINKIPGDSIFAKMSKSLLKKSIGGIKEKILNESSMMDAGESSKYAAGTNQWRDEVGKALRMLGQSPLLTNTVLRRMAQESGGDPRALNDWDSNARRGTPSKGLMQVIDPTFRAYKMPGYGNIWNPLDNILASMRYALARYGSLSAAYNRRGGYAVGTDSATAGWHMVGENGPELMRFNGGEQVYNRQQTMRLAELASKGGTGGGVGAVYVQNPWTGEYHEARMLDVVEGHDSFKASVGRMGHGHG